MTIEEGLHQGLVVNGMPAGELRALGIEVEPNVPDVAKLILDVDMDKGTVSHDGSTLNVTMSIKVAFEWVTVNCTIGPPGSYKPD